MRIFHRCGGRENLEPSELGDFVAEALAQEGFYLGFIQDAADTERYIAMEYATDFWRADLEDGLLRAS